LHQGSLPHRRPRARAFLLLGRAWLAIGNEAADQGRGATTGCKLCRASRAAALNSNVIMVHARPAQSELFSLSGRCERLGRLGGFSRPPTETAQSMSLSWGNKLKDHQARTLFSLGFFFVAKLGLIYDPRL